MSTTSIAQPTLPRFSLSGHAVRLIVGYAAALTVIFSVAIYGFDYYTLDAAQRPYSAKHALLKPSGAIGIKLGVIGLLMFLVIFLYPLRKRWAWLSRQGSTKHWMDFHVLLGVFAPFVIAFHGSFKFRGFAGMAFWIMTAVALSGVVGRYLYGQIPRRVTAAELSLGETRDMQEQYADALASQRLIRQTDLWALFDVPTEAQVARMPVVVALGYMIFLDLIRPFRIARLRRRTLSGMEWLSTLGGLFQSSHVELEKAVAAARDYSSLSKRLAFLSRAQRVFHLWHVVHKPFSYSFAVLAIFHIGVVWMLGYL
ncbi:MAG: hypothetical protein LAN70_15360 [Acidobacteriia bacterium]|nr:hypothetical protein [Terriglobia bacterium]